MIVRGGTAAVEEAVLDDEVNQAQKKIGSSLNDRANTDIQKSVPVLVQIQAKTPAGGNQEQIVDV